MQIDFSGEIWYWRGPAPHHFVSVPAAECDVIKDEWSFACYGWGMIPVTVQIGASSWDTSLFPKDGLYIVPIKSSVRAAEQLHEGDVPSVCLTVRTTAVRRSPSNRS